MAAIKKIYAYEIIDSRGNPTIEGKLILDTGQEVITSIPSGTSIGKHEAVELRDQTQTRFDGKGVTQAIAYINDLLGPKLVGTSPLKQKEIDEWLIKADATKNKSRLGANTCLTISQLMIKAGAVVSGMSTFRYINDYFGKLYNDIIEINRIPTPIFDVINGGKHANDGLDFQEFQYIPSSSFSFAKAYEMGVELFYELRRVLEYRNASISVGEEGGFTPNFSTNFDAIEVIIEAIGKKKLQLGVDIFLGLDIAASHFYKDETYMIKDKPKPLKTDEYLVYLKELIKKYTFLVLEDPLQEDDWNSWHKFDELIAKEIYLVGDDLISANKERLLKAIKDKSCSTVLVKPTQIGTISETLEIIDIARKNNFNYIISHRSGETNDTLIADLAVAVQADFVKFGGPSRGERVAKYNRLWQIEREELNNGQKLESGKVEK